MDGTMVEVRSSMQEQQQAAEAHGSTPAAPPPPPPPHRRPRVREVSSRFMSPVVSSSSSGDLHLLPTKSPISKHANSVPAEFQSRQQQQRSNSAQRRRHQEFEPLCCADENRPETLRSLDTPLGSHLKAAISMQRKHRAVKHLKENGGRGDRMIASRFRPATPNFQRSTEISATPASTAAAKLLQSSGMSLSAQTPSVGNKVNVASLSDDDKDDRESAQNVPRHETSSESGSCASYPVPVQKCKTWSLSVPDCRSSMPEADMLPTVSSRQLAERFCSRGNVNVIGGDFSKASASPCSRSLNLTPSGCEQSLFYSIKTSEKPASLLLKASSNSVKIGGVCLPPLAPCTKLGMDGRKGWKVSGHQDVHSLRLLHSHYLQWRFANAKAEASTHSQRKETEKILYSIGVKVCELRDSVKKKQTELALLQRAKRLSTILEAQMPYLDEWSTLEGDYSSFLSEAIQALSNASLQLPISGNIRADISEVGEALNSAIKLMETITFQLQSFMPKTEEIDNLTSELAGVIGGERAFVQECGDLLSKTYTMQVEECSLRGQLIQIQQSGLCQPSEE